MRFVFLDIDGVLNNENTKDMTPSGHTGVSMKLIRNLAEIIKATDARIILTSDWKYGWSDSGFCCDEDIIYLKEKLKKLNLRIYNRTYDNKMNDVYFTDRGAGIREYLEHRDDVEGYVIIDDRFFSDFDSELVKHLVRTDFAKGLTEEKVRQAIEILLQA